MQSSSPRLSSSAHDWGVSHTTSSPALLAPQDAPAAPTRRPYGRLTGEIGWITLARPTGATAAGDVGGCNACSGGAGALVTRRTRLEAGVRQQHIQQWQRRLRIDRAMAADSGVLDKKALRSKLAAAPPNGRPSAVQLELASVPRSFPLCALGPRVPLVAAANGCCGSPPLARSAPPLIALCRPS